MDRSAFDFPPFDLGRLLSTVFAPKPGERVAILIDLDDPMGMRDFAFLKQAGLSIQRLAYEVFYQGLKTGVGARLGLPGVKMFAYQVTGGSNLDLPETLVSSEGRVLSFRDDLYRVHEIILCISTYSATAPLTAAAKRYGFRGATLHGLNEFILKTGLAVDYTEVSQQAERLRRAMTRAEAFEIDFEVDGTRETLRLFCGGQEAQKSHGLCRGDEPDVANLPAGEIYFVPRGAQGRFPMRHEDGTLSFMQVEAGSVQQAVLIKGDPGVVAAYNEKRQADPATGVIGELGFGTQRLPASGRDIQDEKILGTVHIATGRSDHLGGDLTPDKFAEAKNATHDDILFSPAKTPEIKVREVRMSREGESIVLLRDFRPAKYLLDALES